MSQSPYVGQPTTEVEAAWHLLLAPASLRVSEEELQSSDPFGPSTQASVALPNGGRLAWLGVYHELHCVKMLYQANYRHQLHPNLTELELRDLQVHADHCIDQLREAVMCHGDVRSLTTFTWKEGYSRPLLSPERPVHRCMDWGMLVDNLRKRVVGDAEMETLTREQEET